MATATGLPQRVADTWLCTALLCSSLLCSSLRMPRWSAVQRALVSSRPSSVVIGGGGGTATPRSAAARVGRPRQTRARGDANGCIRNTRKRHREGQPGGGGAGAHTALHCTAVTVRCTALESEADTHKLMTRLVRRPSSSLPDVTSVRAGLTTVTAHVVCAVINSPLSAHSATDRCCPPAALPCAALRCTPFERRPFASVAASAPLPLALTMLALHNSNGAFAPPMSNNDLAMSATPIATRAAGTAASVPASPAHAQHTPARRRMSICGQSLQRAHARRIARSCDVPAASS